MKKLLILLLTTCWVNAQEFNFECTSDFLIDTTYDGIRVTVTHDREEVVFSKQGSPTITMTYHDGRGVFSNGGVGLYSEHNDTYWVIDGDNRLVPTMGSSQVVPATAEHYYYGTNLADPSDGTSLGNITRTLSEFYQGIAEYNPIVTFWIQGNRWVDRDRNATFNYWIGSAGGNGQLFLGDQLITNDKRLYTDYSSTTEFSMRSVNGVATYNYTIPEELSLADRRSDVTTNTNVYFDAAWMGALVRANPSKPAGTFYDPLNGFDDIAGYGSGRAGHDAMFAEIDGGPVYLETTDGSIKIAMNIHWNGGLWRDWGQGHLMLSPDGTAHGIGFHFEANPGTGFFIWRWAGNLVFGTGDSNFPFVGSYTDWDSVITDYFNWKRASNSNYPNYGTGN